MEKLSGGELVNHPVITQLLKLKIFFDKIHPLDNKLKYQIDKLLNMAVTQDNTSDIEKSKLSYKANLSNFIDEEASENEEDQETNTGSDKYVPPKRLSVAYDDANSRAEKEANRRIERAKRSQIYEMMKDQFSSAPVEYTSTGFEKDRRSDKKEEMITKFEEENMVRLRQSKKRDITKRKRGHSDIHSGLTDLESFADFASLDFNQKRSKSKN